MSIFSRQTLAQRHDARGTRVSRLRPRALSKAFALLIGLVLVLLSSSAGAAQLGTYFDLETGEADETASLTEAELLISDKAAVNQVDPTVTQQGYSALIAGFGGDCGVYARTPHSSFDYRYEIHARIESVCNVLPVLENRLKGTMYRSRWYGWQTVADQSWKVKTYPNAQYFRRTVVHVCEPDVWHKYRVHAYGMITTSTGTYRASAYDRNFDEIRCKY